MALLHWVRRHPAISIVLALVCGATAFGLHWWFLPSVPWVSSNNVEAIEVEITRPRRGSDKVPPISTTDRAKIQALLDTFRAASRTSEHKCAGSGVIRIRKKNGTELKLSTLPGHDAAYYEYRYAGRINRVDRAQFVTALKEIGVENLRLDPP